MYGSVEDAWNLGAVAVGATIILGLIILRVSFKRHTSFRARA